jgi:hypothetical protein
VLIRSLAGDFDISIKRFEVENGRLVVVGTMGVWDARTYISPRELIFVLGKLMRFSVLLYVLRLPYLTFARGPNQPVPFSED